MDRRQALAQYRVLPETARGSALTADISGFTPLTESFARELGLQRGAEEITRQVNRVHAALIGEVHRFRGSVDRTRLLDETKQVLTPLAEYRFSVHFQPDLGAHLKSGIPVIH